MASPPTRLTRYAVPRRSWGAVSATIVVSRPRVIPMWGPRRLITAFVATLMGKGNGNQRDIDDRHPYRVSRLVQRLHQMGAEGSCDLILVVDHRHHPQQGRSARHHPAAVDLHQEHRTGGMIDVCCDRP